MTVRPFELLLDRPELAATSPRARIALGLLIRDGDRVIVSDECASVREVEANVNRLKRDLDRVVEEARRKFPN